MKILLFQRPMPIFFIIRVIDTFSNLELSHRQPSDLEIQQVEARFGMDEIVVKFLPKKYINPVNQTPLNFKLRKKYNVFFFDFP